MTPFIKHLLQRGPLLAQNWENNKHYFPCYAQPKYNGERAVYYQGKFYTRRGKCWGSNRFEHLKEQLVIIQDSPLDGELYIHNIPFQELSSILSIQNKQPHARETEVSYVVYDYPREALSFNDRQGMLDTLFSFLPKPLIEGASVKLSPLDYVKDANHAHIIHQRNLQDCYEGTMYRMNSCLYRPGVRSYDLLKRKLFDTCIATVHEVELGEKGKKYENCMGALRCSATINDKSVFFSVGSGYSDEERQEFFTNPPKKINVTYQSLSIDNIPQKPVYKGVYHEDIS